MKLKKINELSLACYEEMKALVKILHDIGDKRPLSCCEREHYIRALGLISVIENDAIKLGEL